MIQSIKDFCELISDAIFGLRAGWGVRFVLANFIMRDQLREAVAFARIDVENAIKWYDIAPDLSKKKLKQAYKYLDDLLNMR